MIIDYKDFLIHYGTPRHSGRYPWGSGGDIQATRSKDFLTMVEKLKKEDGLTEKQIAEGMGLTLKQYRAERSIAVNQKRQEKMNTATRLKDTGMSDSAIGREMGINESSVRSLLERSKRDDADILGNLAGTLKSEVDQNKFIDVGTGVENLLDVTRTKLDTAIQMVQNQGYPVHTIKVEQLGTGHLTTYKIMTQPGVTKGDVYKNMGELHNIGVQSDDGGRTALGLKPPMSISSKRIDVKYDEDGGGQADGVIYVRPGVKDISIGSNRYAQVRVAVDGTHYLKGMAMYKDDLPDGVDLQFNTNKSSTGNKLDAMKAMKTDPTTGKIDADNPFGTQLKRQILEGEKGKEKLTSSMNIVYEEGDWGNWSKHLSSQILSKQESRLVKGQLNMTYERKREAYDEIKSLTNPTIKKYFLEKFADGADSSASHLKAAILPGTSYHVILPVKSIKPTEVYAPNFPNGTRVALIRSPHGGRFEIPELTVNNRNREAQKLISRGGKGAPDAIGIHHKVAERLSGADFDGDNVLVVPNDRGHIKSAPALKELEGFDTKRAFPGYPGMKPIGDQDQNEMGKITNLIADMSLQGASNAELARAVRHSMVVIDADKHGLDWQGSFQVNAIADLKEKYQGSKQGGAKTIITRARSQVFIPERKLRRASKGGHIDPETGKKVYEYSDRTYIDKKGVERKKGTRQRALLAETEDAFLLSSGTEIENLYAAHSNKLKSLANEARKEILVTHDIKQSKSAKTAYSKEVASLDSKLNEALKNAPLERQAQAIGNAVYSQRLQANPNMDKATKKKIKNQALVAARKRTGADKHRIHITDSEWNAIQGGAISKTTLEKILYNSDIDRLRELATPPKATKMTSAKATRAKQMERVGYTQAEIAQALGVSVSTVKATLNVGGDDDE